MLGADHELLLASAALEVNVDGAGFVAAHRLSRVASDQFVGSAFFLPEDTAYEVRVTPSDPLIPHSAV